MKKQKSKVKAKQSAKPLQPVKPAAPLVLTKENMAGRLVDPYQELFYEGPPPAIKPLYKTNTGYVKDFHPKDLLIWSGQGYSPTEVAAMWGISANQFADWCAQYTELAEAKKLAATLYEAYYKKALRLAAFGQLPNMSEKSLHKILDNQVGMGVTGMSEYADVGGAEGEIVGTDGTKYE